MNYAFSPLAVYLCGSAERRLLNDLMASYQKLERPVYNETEPVFSDTQKYLANEKKYMQVILKFGLTLQQIMDVVRNIAIVLIAYLGSFTFNLIPWCGLYVNFSTSSFLLDKDPPGYSQSC